ncbi:MAG TPA: NUDIX hydrolase [Streptosporangiaceae bacterium]|nr:NUDIX hydrolase [Streptosporangiaceae bacterium]
MPDEHAARDVRWVVHAERLVDENPHVRLSLADVELPDGRQFTQYVFRMRRCVMTLALNEAGSHMLLVWRHRFIIDRWVWELPGGYIDDGEDGATAATRETEEETGWRPRNARFLLSYQPMIGNADFPQDLYLAHGADHVGHPAPDEAASVRWVGLDEAATMVSQGEIVGAATVIGVQQALLRRAGIAQPAG